MLAVTTTMKSLDLLLCAIFLSIGTTIICRLPTSSALKSFRGGGEGDVTESSRQGDSRRSFDLFLGRPDVRVMPTYSVRSPNPDMRDLAPKGNVLTTSEEERRNGRQFITRMTNTQPPPSPSRIETEMIVIGSDRVSLTFILPPSTRYPSSAFLFVGDHLEFIRESTPLVCRLLTADTSDNPYVYAGDLVAASPTMNPRVPNKIYKSDLTACIRSAFEVEAGGARSSYGAGGSYGAENEGASYGTGGAGTAIRDVVVVELSLPCKTQRSLCMLEEPALLLQP